jgi:hypothetical protein
MKKLLLFGLAGLLIILVAGVLIALSSINAIAKKAIQSGGGYALGTQVKVDSVSVGLLSGKFSLAGLEVANPTGAATFRSPHFLSLGHGAVAVSAGSLRQPVVELPSLTLDTLSINLEKSGEVTNYKAILDNLAKVSGGSEKPAAGAGSEKKFVIRDLDLRNINVSVDLIGGPGAVSNLTRVNVPIDRIQLTDVGKTGTGIKGTGVTLGELSAIIVKAILAAAADKGGDIIPGDVLGDLKGKLALLQGVNLDELKVKVTADVQKKADELKEKALNEGKKKLDEAAEKIKGLLPGGDGKK